jgi:mono/diheme cytochrome c family protein
MDGRRWTVGVGLACVCVLTGVAASVAPGAGPRSASADSTRDVYVKSCAPCHGETGDGKGVTVLTRPARSFKDGGFSYGNTPEALLRTITHGIPGSLMPSFKDALGEEQRKALAAYVLTLGPPVLDVKPQETRMVVRECAVVARGKLPPIVEGAPERPRGLLIGLPSGLTFEYRTDDVRLLGVRSGEFADRTDWVGRGGTYLQPLGQVVRVTSGDVPVFLHTRDSVNAWETLACRLVATTVRGSAATVSYDLVAPDGRPVARVEETPAAIDTALGPGWKRAFASDTPRTKLLACRFTCSGAEFGRIDGTSGFACRPAGNGVGVDLTIARGAAHVDDLDGEVIGLDSGIDLMVSGGEPAVWNVYEIPGVKLPEGAVERRKAIESVARELR